MKLKQNNKGAAILIVVLFFVILSVTLITGVSGPVGYQIRNTSDFLQSKQSYSVADAQAENALYRLNHGKSDAPTIMSLLGATATITLTDIGGDKEMSIQGAIGDFQRFVKARFKQDAGVAFNYGLQTGIGGVQMGGSSHIIGNVYANGDISGNGGSGWASTVITGSATAATLSNPVAHIDNTGSSTPTYSHFFGLTAGTQDFAQSFVISTTTAISEIQLYIKKTGAPANYTVKIVNNSSGQPGTTVLTSGTLNSSLVTSVYSYVPVVMTTSVSLTSGSTYWIVIDNPTTSAVNYYTLGLNNGVYSAGAVKTGAMGGTWSNIATTTADAYIKVLVGGDAGTITGMKVGTDSGNAWAKNITNVIVSGSLYCQIGSGNSKACDTSRADPTPNPLPISTANLDEWKDEATAGGSTSSVSIAGSNTRTMGPIKINGNLTMSASGVLYITGPIYITGNISVSGNAKIYVHSSLGSVSGILVSDGRITLGGSGGVYGSGTAGSYVVMASNSDCPASGSCSGNPAIDVSGDAGSVVLSAPNGTVSFSGSGKAKSIVAKQMIMSGDTEVSYDSGLADLDFSSGPSGSWTVDTWKEVPSL